ncbi:MAG: hypothetical protein SF069_14630 [Phycisphaerae bacterium]|nr:hypothetical protein [Phycisphaerae bacterium]
MLLILRMAAFFTLAAGAGLVTAQVRNCPLFPNEERLSCEKQAKKTRAIDLAAFKAHYASGNLVIDARSAEEFQKGHLACPLIMNVPTEAAGDHMDRLMAFSGQPIVIYCTSLDCDLAEQLYCRLEPMGFVDMKLFPPGWQDGILKEDLPIATGPESDGAGAAPSEATPPTDAASESAPASEENNNG